MNLNIRLEQPHEWHEVEVLTREAFWREDRIEKIGIGCDEHYLAHTLRTSVDFIPELNFVAELEGRLVGNVMFTKAYIEMPNGCRHEVINFGPLSVLPKLKKQGIGSALMRHALKEAARLGYGAVLFFGHPTYYPRFGFKEASAFNITTCRGDNYPAFMAMELIVGDLDGISGKFHETPLYNVDPEAARQYDLFFREK